MTIIPPYLKDVDGNTLYFPSKFYVRSESISRRSSLVQLPYSNLSKETSDGCFNPRRVDVSGVLYAEDEATARTLLDSIHAFSNKKGLELWFKGRRIKIDKLLECTIQDSGKRGFLYNVSVGFQAGDPFWYSEEKNISLNISWKKKKEITINNSIGKETTNVPVCIRIQNDSDIGALCRSDGYDVRFLDSDGTELAQYRKSFAVSSGQATGEFWVMIPTLPAAGKTIYCIYGNSSATDVSNSSVNPDILTDGDFEQWNSSTDLIYWTEYIDGSSSVNRESTEKTRGNYAVRSDIDGSNSAGNIGQSLFDKISPNKFYKFSLMAKTSVSGKTIRFIITADISDTKYYFDFDNLVWTNTGKNRTNTVSNNFANYSVYFHSSWPSGTLTDVNLFIDRNIANSSSLFYDDATIFRADSYDACDIAADSWYNQSSVVSWGQVKDIAGFEIAGNVDTFPLIQVTMLGSASSLTLGLNGQTCQFNAPLSQNDVLEIDSYHGTVKLNGEDMIRLFSGLFPVLQPGENTVEITGGDCLAEIAYSEAYI